MNEPTTEAGKRHAEKYHPRCRAYPHTHYGECPDIYRPMKLDSLAAIEAEARNATAEEIAAGAVFAERARLRAAVETIHPDGAPCVCVAAVLEMLDGPPVADVTHYDSTRRIAATTATPDPSSEAD